MTVAPCVVIWWLASGLFLASVSTMAACDRAQPEPDSTVVLSWSREGGLAGFCDELKVTASGDATASSCSVAGVKRRKLPSDELARLKQWQGAYASVTATSRDAATADALTMKIALSGKGQTQPSDELQRELFDWAQRVYQQTK